jgi:hypothetical protein
MATPTRRRTRTRTPSAAATDPVKPTDAAAALTCPECSRSFSRPAALGAHRQRAHGVAGSSQNARSRRGRNNTTAAAKPRRGRTQGASAAPTAASKGATRRNTDGRVDHDALLSVLFPVGIPPRRDIVVAVNDWLTEADNLARRR